MGKCSTMGILWVLMFCVFIVHLLSRPSPSEDGVGVLKSSDGPFWGPRCEKLPYGLQSDA